MSEQLQKVCLTKKEFIVDLTCNLLQELYDVLDGLDGAGKLEDKLKRIRLTAGKIQTEIAELRLTNKLYEEKKWKLPKSNPLLQPNN